MAFAKKLGIAGRWLLQLLIAAAFISIGLGKFGDSFWERSFQQWGYPPGSHLVIGAIELVCGALILIPRLTTYAASVLAVVMIGAMATHAIAGQSWTRPAPHLCLLLAVAFVRRRDRWRPRAVAVTDETPLRS